MHPDEFEAQLTFLRRTHIELRLQLRQGADARPPSCNHQAVGPRAPAEGKRTSPLPWTRTPAAARTTGYARRSAKAFQGPLFKTPARCPTVRPCHGGGAWRGDPASRGRSWISSAGRSRPTRASSPRTRTRCAAPLASTAAAMWCAWGPNHGVGSNSRNDPEPCK